MSSAHAPQLVTALPGPNARRVLAKDATYMSPSYTRSYPLVADRGAGMFITDVDGNRFLDFTAGIAVTATGHCHPEVVKAAQEQVARLIHMSGTDFYYRLQSDLAERLASIVPITGPKKVFFTNSGTEAVEAAMKLARYHTRRTRFVAFLGAFHGRTLGALGLTASKAVQRRHFSPMMPDATHVPYGYCFRCPYHLTYSDCNLHCVAAIKDMYFSKVCPPEDVAAIIVEPIQGEGGYVVPPPDYFAALRRLCDEYGILLVVDEIQSGMGRTGKMFAIEHWGIQPDIVAIAKGIASGFPLGAMVSRADLQDWPSGAHANTFGGNPVACAAALKTIDLLQGGLLSNAGRMGALLMDRLRAFQATCPAIVDVRGKGLMIGAEVEAADGGMAGAHALRDRIVQEAFERGVLLLGCGENVIRFCPPLVVEAGHIEAMMTVLREAFKAALGSAGRAAPKRAKSAARSAR